jgi:hypothetical protein
MDAHLVIARAQVELGEESGVVEFIDEFFYHGGSETCFSPCIRSMLGNPHRSTMFRPVS